ncbi:MULTISPECIES: SpoIVB peptidase [Clostridia]|mgnify:FL=1|uniref:SpoIVB peptidase n=2 Tax=Clostridia TaxID=186801 RepID=A0A8I0DN90_9CLOT|nr:MULTISPECIES: SpoIVB peptidase [Clostridia]MBC5640164.1 SpoIVB peptidase [Clostridium lentum]MBC5654382.1 SpoIVB peptidase [Blautia lenta]CDB75550.1 peptidase S55 [Clostridium sp. CAG:265]
MIKKLIKNFSIITAPIFILVLIGVYNNSQADELSIKNRMKDTTSYVMNDVQNADSIDCYTSLINSKELTTLHKEKRKNIEVYPGGISIGVKINNKGALVVGYSDISTYDGLSESPGKIAGIELGDIIEEVNGENIETCSDLISKVKSCRNDELTVKILRGNSEITKKVPLIKEDNEYKIGLWVRDSTAGIGTLTFYDKDSKTFGALGHPITDGDTNVSFNIKSGTLLRSSILSIKKGERGNPGEIKGLFINENESIGTIEKNTSSGIYGDGLTELINPNFNKAMTVAYRDEIKEGHAQIITTVEDDGAKAYDIEILKLLPQDEPGSKSMIIKIVDPVLLEKTGGIVQGMSGSPIIQNGKIIGAVTHVLINKPDVGYGIYIEWMLQDAGVIK